MTIYLIRTTIQASNPQSIREIEIEQNHTVKELADIISMAYGCKKGCVKCRETMDGEWKKLQDSRLCDFDFDENWSFELRNTRSSQARFAYVVVEKITEREDKKYQFPQVVKSYGYNISEKIQDLHTMNRCTYLWEDGYEIHGWGYGNRISKEKLTCNLSQINRSLQRVYAPHTIDQIVDMEYAVTPSTILNRKTINELYRIIDEYEFDININGCSKADILLEMEEEYGDDFFDAIMSELTVGEYMQLKQLCKTGVCEKDALRYLEQRGIVFFLPDKTPWIADSFLLYYEEWIISGEEEKYLLEQAYCEVVTFACNLYGVVTKERLWELLIHYHSGKNWTKTLFGSMWNATYDGRMISQIVGYGKYLYNEEDLDIQNVTLIQNVLKNDTIEEYVPSYQELQHIVRNGCDFPPECQEKLVYIFMKYLDESTARDFIHCIELDCHLGTDIETIVWRLEEGIGGMSSRDEVDFKNILFQYVGEIRMVRYKGHTINEVQALSKRKGNK